VNYFTKTVSNELIGGPVQLGILSPGMVRTEFLSVAQEMRSPEEIKHFKKVYDVLAEDTDVVTRFLVDGLLKSTKHYDRIEFLTTGKLMVRLVKMMFK